MFSAVGIARCNQGGVYPSYGDIEDIVVYEHSAGEATTPRYCHRTGRVRSGTRGNW